MGRERPDWWRRYQSVSDGPASAGEEPFASAAVSFGNLRSEHLTGHQVYGNPVTSQRSRVELSVVQFYFCEEVALDGRRGAPGDVSIRLNSKDIRVDIVLSRRGGIQPQNVVEPGPQFLLH